MADLVRTDEVLTTEALMVLFDAEELPSNTVGTCAGEWRRNAGTETWTFWKDPEWDA